VPLTRLVFVALLFLVRSSAVAAAGDYSVAYAIDAHGKNDAGKVETCEYDSPCEITSSSLGLSIVLDFIRPDHHSVELRVNGPPGCCYSADAAKTIYLKIDPTVLRVRLYEGRSRRRNEFVQNTLFGILYLAFSDMR
jgi:hypothetical protein